MRFIHKDDGEQKFTKFINFIETKRKKEHIKYSNLVTVSELYAKWDMFEKPEKRISWELTNRGLFQGFHIFLLLKPFGLPLLKIF